MQFSPANVSADDRQQCLTDRLSTKPYENQGAVVVVQPSYLGRKLLKFEVENSSSHRYRVAVLER
jgi:hypothetical protein